MVWDEIYDEETRTHRKVRNADATEAAEQKLLVLQERFSLWVWENSDYLGSDIGVLYCSQQGKGLNRAWSETTCNDGVPDKVWIVAAVGVSGGASDGTG